MQKLIKENLDKELDELNNKNYEKNNELAKKKGVLLDQEKESERLKKE